MKIKWKIGYLVFILMLGFSVNHNAQSLEENAQKVESLHSRQVGLCIQTRVFVIDSLLASNRVGGIVLDENVCSSVKDISIQDPGDLSLYEKLDSLININPLLRWKEEDGVINLVPSNGTPELLNTKIATLTLEFDSDFNLVTDRLLQTPEIRTKAGQLNIREGIRSIGLSSPRRNTSLTRMNFKGKTLFQILNAIVKKRERGVWSYREYIFKGEKEFSLTFVVKG